MVRGSKKDIIERHPWKIVKSLRKKHATIYLVRNTTATKTKKAYRVLVVPNTSKSVGRIREVTGQPFYSYSVRGLVGSVATDFLPRKKAEEAYKAAIRYVTWCYGTTGSRR